MSLAVSNANHGSLAKEFISRSGSISPSVLRLGGGASSAMSVRELESAIVADPEFTLRALALANSAFYSQQHEINSLRGALVVLGVDAVHNLAASLLAKALHASPTATDERLWEHCQAVGVAAQILSESHRQTDPKQAFAAGLLHDIGLLALQTLGRSDDDAHVHHAGLGADIAELLGLSPSLVAAIRFHDETGSAREEVTPLEATIFIANEIVEQCGYGLDGDSSGDQSRVIELAAQLTLEESDLEALIEALPSRLENHQVSLHG